MADTYVTTLAAGGAIRVLKVDVSETAAEVVRRHKLLGRSARLAAELVAANVLLAAWVKGEERVLLQLQAEYPEGATFMGEVDAEGHVRARFLPESLPGEGPRITGLLLAIKSDATQEMYRGVTEIIDEPIADALERHLRISDQVPALVRIAVTGPAESPSVVGIVAERLPDDGKRPSLDREAFDAVVAPLRAIEDAQLGDAVLGAAWHDGDIEPLEERPLVHQCRCSRERVFAMLRGLGDDEVRAMRDEDLGAEVSCHFCNEVYRFDVADLNAVLLPEAEA